MSGYQDGVANILADIMGHAIRKAQRDEGGICRLVLGTYDDAESPNVIYRVSHVKDGDVLWSLDFPFERDRAIQLDG